jgi:uncharacterized protein YdhG (YjbR/CyaY superfamily)
MMTKNLTNVNEYIAAQPTAAQMALKSVRSAIRKALPDAEEVISYKIPAYKMSGRALLYFAAWKQHYSLYLASESVLPTLKNQLAPYKVNKGTIRFSLSEPVPVSLIGRIAKLRAKEVARRRAKKSTFRNP